MIFTLDAEFEDWVAQVQKERTDKILAEQKLGINLDPEIASIFANSKAISSKCHYISIWPGWAWVICFFLILSVPF